MTIDSSKNSIGATSANGGEYDPTYPLLTAINSSFDTLLIDPNTNPFLLNADSNRVLSFLCQSIIQQQS